MATLGVAMVLGPRPRSTARTDSTREAHAMTPEVEHLWRASEAHGDALCRGVYRGRRKRRKAERRYARDARAFVHALRAEPPADVTTRRDGS